MFGTHYRKKLDWSDDALAAAREGSQRLGQFQNRLLEAKSDTDSPRFKKAAEQLERDLAEALNDDLNAPRAVAALFAYMNEGNAALDASDRPGPVAISAWERAEGVLGVTSRVSVMKVKAGSGAVASDSATAVVTPPVTPPSDPVAAEEWAKRWAIARAQYKSSRNYAEADRIRTLLGEHGFQVRDSRDGSIDVVRTAAPKA
jgi:cysteinyl-tRNA synthetase